MTKRKLLQINVTANWGSTGRIVDMCCKYASQEGWECYEAYGRYNNPSEFQQIKVGSKFNVYEHYAENLIFDREGLASRKSTRDLIKLIKSLQPYVIHLHNIHDHWLNYKILFEYLNQTNIRVVWTFHDFWGITGHCTHFVNYDCEQFKTECHDCPFARGKFLPLTKRTKRNFNLKKQLFTANKHLTIVPVSKWVGEIVRQSFLKDKEIMIIPNGVDTNVFRPTMPTEFQKSSEDFKRMHGRFVIMAVSSQWKSSTKGLNDYKKMAEILKDDEVIVLVGVNDKTINNLPSNIIGIKRTNSQQELAALYTRADVIVSFSSAETFGLTIVEGYACGTPAVVYNNTAPPSLITPDTGIVVPNHDYVAAYNAIQTIKKYGKKNYERACVQLAKDNYSKEKCYENYVRLYESMITRK